MNLLSVLRRVKGAGWKQKHTFASHGLNSWLAWKHNQPNIRLGQPWSCHPPQRKVVWIQQWKCCHCSFIAVCHIIVWQTPGGEAAPLSLLSPSGVSTWQPRLMWLPVKSDRLFYQSGRTTDVVVCTVLIKETNTNKDKTEWTQCWAVTPTERRCCLPQRW